MDTTGTPTLLHKNGSQQAA